jgi:hypothetical protein
VACLRPAEVVQDLVSELDAQPPTGTTVARWRQPGVRSGREVGLWPVNRSQHRGRETTRRWNWKKGGIRRIGIDVRVYEALPEAYFWGIAHRPREGTRGTTVGPPPSPPDAPPDRIPPSPHRETAMSTKAPPSTATRSPEAPPAEIPTSTVDPLDRIALTLLHELGMLQKLDGDIAKFSGGILRRQDWFQAPWVRRNRECRVPDSDTDNDFIDVSPEIFRLVLMEARGVAVELPPPQPPNSPQAPPALPDEGPAWLTARSLARVLEVPEDRVRWLMANAPRNLPGAPEDRGTRKHAHLRVRKELARAWYDAASAWASKAEGAEPSPTTRPRPRARRSSSAGEATARTEGGRLYRNAGRGSGS